MIGQPQHVRFQEALRHLPFALQSKILDEIDRAAAMSNDADLKKRFERIRNGQEEPATFDEFVDRLPRDARDGIYNTYRVYRETVSPDTRTQWQQLIPERYYATPGVEPLPRETAREAAAAASGIPIGGEPELKHKKEEKVAKEALSTVNPMIGLFLEQASREQQNAYLRSKGLDPTGPGIPQKGRLSQHQINMIEGNPLRQAYAELLAKEPDIQSDYVLRYLLKREGYDVPENADTGTLRKLYGEMASKTAPKFIMQRRLEERGLLPQPALVPAGIPNVPEATFGGKPSLASPTIVASSAGAPPVIVDTAGAGRRGPAGPAVPAIPKMERLTEFEKQLPAWMVRPMRDISAQATALRQTGFPRYEPASPSERRLAPIPEDMIQAMEMGRQTGSYGPSLERSEQAVTGAMTPFPEQAQQYMNPYQQAVIDRIRTEGIRTLREGVMPQLRDKFVRAGHHGSGRHQEMSERAARDMLGEITAAQAKTLHHGYEQAAHMHASDQARRLQGAQALGNIGTQKQAGRFADIAALENQARYLQGVDQQRRNLAYEQHLREQQAPWEGLNMEAQLLRGMPLPPANAFFHPQPRPYEATPYTPSGAGQLGQLAGQLAGMARMGGIG